MIQKEVFKQVLNYVLVVGLFILAFLVLKPIFYAIIYGILLAYLFYPIYRWTLRNLKNETLSALIVCLGVILIIIFLSVIILIALLDQAVDFYLTIQKTNVGEIFSKIFPRFLSNTDISETLITSVNNSSSKLIAKFVVSLGDFILNLPGFFLQFFVLALIFFYGLRDGEKAIEYFKSLSPMKKEIQNKFFKNFEDITQSVIVGQIIVGIIQGLVAGVGYFIFGVNNSLLLTILTMVIGVIPVIGPWLIWIPVDVYLFVIGRENAALGLLIYGLLLINWIDNIIRPMIVARRTQINQAIILVGMIGGIYIFGIIGLILGPLILAYVLLVLELYRKQNLEDNIIFKKSE